MHGQRERLFGVDFSGAIDAGRHIWITEARRLPSRELVVERCSALEDSPGSPRDRDAALSALRAIAANIPDSLWGFDFPMSVPVETLGGRSWREFLASIPRQFPTPESFRAHCIAEAGGRELRRATDRDSQTPFSPYNLRMYRQTFHGLAGVVAPLVLAGRVAVAPFQPAVPGFPTFVEICPASTLKRMGLYQPYKGTRRSHATQRRRIASEIESRCGLRFLLARDRRRMLADARGDALDSLVALAGVLAAERWLETATTPPVASLTPEAEREGWVFF